MNKKEIQKVLSVLVVVCIVLTMVVTLPANLVRADTQATYYVDPVNGIDTNNGTSTGTAFRTITKARDVVRTINSSMTGDIYVYLRGGEYNLTSTIAFTPSDSGINGYNVIYKAFNNEVPVITGYRPITGWTLYDSGKNIYRASAAGDIETRSLYVNGVRAQRARSTGGLASSTTDTVGHTTTDKSILSWVNVSDVEMVYQKLWTNTRCGVASAALSGDGTRAEITMKQPGWYYCQNKASTSVTGGPVYVENAYELLDEEGEWYLNRATDYFYYKPKAGENMFTASVKAPTIEKMITIEGTTIDTPVHNMQFWGITFAYSTYLRPNGNDAHPDIQGNIIRERRDGKYWDYLSLAAVSLTTAKSILFERCDFTKMGGVALSMRYGSQDNLVRGCRFIDISAGGVMVGDVDANDVNNRNPSDPKYLLKNIDVVNNYFNEIGVEFGASCAVFGGYPEDMNISYNEISDVSWSGISVGWGWNFYTGGTSHKYTNIQYNKIFDTVKRVQDGGSIYTLGNTGGSASQRGIIANNYFSHVTENGGVGAQTLYLDEGSSWWDVNNNVCESTGHRWLKIWTSTIHDNVVNNNYTNNQFYQNEGTNCTVSNTTVVSELAWPTAAQTIKNNAGIQTAYQDIKKKRIEAETFIADGNYAAESNGFYSNGKGLKANLGTTGSAYYVLNGDTGIYDLNVAYIQEDDGQAAHKLYINDVKLDEWTAALAPSGTYPVTSRIKRNVVIHKGDKIKLEGIQTGGSHARVDYMEITDSPVQYSVSEIFDNDVFDASTQNIAPSSWTCDTSGGTVWLVNIAGNRNKAAKTDKTTTANKAIMTYPFTAASGVVAVEGRFKTDESTGWKCLYVKDSNNVDTVSLAMDGGYIKAYNGSTSTDLAPFSNGQWYTIKVVINTDTDKYDVYVDGVKKLSQQNTRNAVSNIGILYYGIGANHTGTLYCDWVDVYKGISQ